MRMLHVTQFYFPALGGAEEHVKKISEGLASKGHAVSVFTSDLSPFSLSRAKVPRKETIANVDVHRFKAIMPLSGGKRRGGETGALVSKIAKSLTSLDQRRSMAQAMLLMRAISYPFMPGMGIKMLACLNQFDIVVGWQFPWPAPLQAFITSRIRRRPFIIYPIFHVGRPTYECESFYSVLAKADGVIALTPHERDHFLSLGVKEDRISLVSVGVDLEDYRHAEGGQFRKRHGVGDRFIALFIGRREFDKGYYDVIRSMGLVWKTLPDAILVLIGQSSTFKSRSEDFATELAAKREAEAVLQMHSDKIIDLGAPPDEVKNEALAAADVLVVPSRVEAFGIVYLEAWANKTPIIAATKGPACTFVDDGKDGFLVDFADYVSIAQRIGSLAANRGKAREMGRSGFHKVIEEFTWEKQPDKLEAFYELTCQRWAKEHGRQRG